MAGAFERERKAARELVLEAGKIVLGYYEEGFNVEWKAKDDPVTEADKAANELILARLGDLFPGDPILSEESHDDLVRLESERVWIVDPLDGTKDFVQRTGDFAVMLGLAFRGEPVVGAVCQPFGPRVWHAAKGAGAVLEREGRSPENLKVSSIAETSSMRLVVTRTHRYPEIEEIVRSLGITEEHPLGSVGLKVGAISTADADLYAHVAPGTKEWDTCAPGAILVEAGGTMTDSFGDPLSYNQRDVKRTRGVVASNGCAHHRIIEVIAPIAEAAGLGRAEE